jgi:fluoride exporter
MNAWLAVFIGGGLGSLCRFGISRWASTWNVSFPIATLCSNLLASAILALGVGWFASRGFSNDSWPVLFLLVGFCGGFSTFSTFSLETLELFRSGHIWWAILNVAVSVGACLLAIALLYKAQ